jgi:integrase
MRMLFLLIVWSGLRLKEAYTLTVGQVDIRSRLILVRSSKQWYGREKWRRVPIRPELLSELSKYLAEPFEGAGDTLLFPFWNGTQENLAPTTNRLSQRFRGLFAYSGCFGSN